MCYAESLVRGKPRCTTCISCVAKIFLYNLELYRLSLSFSLSFLLTGVLSIACSHRGCCPSSFSLPLLSIILPNYFIILVNCFIFIIYFIISISSLLYHIYFLLVLTNRYPFSIVNYHLHFYALYYRD